MLGGIFRDTLRNQTIPDQLRGRLAGVELLSYSVGPAAGQIRARAVAAVTSTRFSLASGAVACAGVVCLALPGFLAYSSRASASRMSSSSTTWPVSSSMSGTSSRQAISPKCRPPR